MINEAILGYLANVVGEDRDFVLGKSLKKSCARC